MALAVHESIFDTEDNRCDEVLSKGLGHVAADCLRRQLRLQAAN